MINLVAKLVLDATGFTRGLASAADGARKVGGTIGSEVGKDFAKGLKRAIGAGAIAGAVVALGKESQQIRDMARALGVTSQQYAAMEYVQKRLGDTTNVTADEFERLVNAVIQSGQIPSDNIFDKLADGADRAQTAFQKLKVAGGNLLSGIVRGTEAIGAGIGASVVLEDKRDGTFMEKLRQRYEQYARESARVLEEGGVSVGDDLFKNVKREPFPDLEKDKAKETVKAEKEERMKEGRTTPIGAQTPGSLQSIGLGPGLGQFNFAKVMVDEQRKTTAAVNRLNATITKKL